MNHQPVSIENIVAIVMIGGVAIAAILSKGDPGLTVAAAAVGGIAGWLTRGPGKTANVQAENATVQADGEHGPPA